MVQQSLAQPAEEEFLQPREQGYRSHHVETGKFQRVYYAFDGEYNLRFLQFSSVMRNAHPPVELRVHTHDTVEFLGCPFSKSSEQGNQALFQFGFLSYCLGRHNELLYNSFNQVHQNRTTEIYCEQSPRPYG